MDYKYGKFSNKQIKVNVQLMHNDIHKLLIYKDPKISNFCFDSDDEFFVYFENLLYRFGGLNNLFGRPVEMVNFMSTLQAAYDEVCKTDFDYNLFRKLILNAHGYLTSMFEGRNNYAKS